MVGFANITENGQYIPSDFDHQTGQKLPEGQSSNNQYLNQVIVNVPQQPIFNPLEVLTNKRLDQEQIYTISDLMNDPINNAGITKNSTLIVDLPDFPPTTSQKILNLTENTTSPQTIYPPTGEYWNSIHYSVNVKINLSISDIQLGDDVNNRYSLNKQSINWTYNLGSSVGRYGGAIVISELSNYYYLYLVRVEDNGANLLHKADGAIGNYIYESTCFGPNTNGQISIFLKNKIISTLYDYGNDNADLNHCSLYLYKTDYLITDFGQ